MARLYKRNVQVILTEDISSVPSSIRATTTQQITIPSTLTGDQLKISFDVESNQASSVKSDNIIQIWNLKGETQSFIKNRKLFVQLLAGYDGEASNIYTGTVVKVDTIKKGIDVITKMTLGNLVYNINEALFSKSYFGIVQTRRIIEDSLQSLNLNYQYLELIPDSSQQINFCFDGKTQDLWNLLLLPIGLQWFTDNGVLKISRQGQPNENTAILVTQESGLVNVPVKTDKGVDIELLLNNSVELSNTVNVQLNTETVTSSGRTTNILNQELNGIYKISSIRHMGDTIEGKFVTKMECILPESSSE